MKYCGNCGSEMNDGSKYCGECGVEFGKIQNSIERDNDSIRVNNLKGFKTKKSSSAKSEKLHGKRKGFRWWMIPLWIFLFPFMVVYTIFKTEGLSQKYKIIISVAFIIIFFYMGKDQTKTNNTKPNVNNVSTVQQGSTSNIKESTKVEDVKEVELLRGVSDNDAAENMISAIKLIGMEIRESDTFSKKDPWAGGDRYSLTYKGNQVLIYMNGDKSVNSINVGDIKVFEDGYEPLQIEDYLTNTEMDAQITLMAKDLIKMTLNYPDTAKFPWLDWGYARVNNIYAVSSHVEAKNAFGVQSTIPFYIEFELNETSTKPVYLVLDGKVVSGDKSLLKAPEKVKLEEETKPVNEDGSFEITDGELGTYGKKEILDGKEYIYYYLPEGKYRVTTTMNVAAVLVLRKDPYKNSDGYLEHEIVSMNRFESSSDIKEITVRANEKVMVTINSKFKFTPLE